MLWAAPADTPLRALASRTSTGTVLQGIASGPQTSGPELDPSPSCPDVLAPQAITLPSPSRARPCAPAEIVLTSLSPFTLNVPLLQAAGSDRTHCSEPVSLPSPSWPCAFPPHALTVPSFSSARPNVPPAEIAATSLSPLTGTGTSLPSVLPSPS